MNELLQHPRVVIEVVLAYWAFSAIVTGMPKPRDSNFWGTWIYDTLHLFVGSVKQFADKKIQTLTEETTTTTVAKTEVKPSDVVKSILLFGLLLLPSVLQAQTMTTVTGVIQGPTGVPATTGYVEFQLMPASNAVTYYVNGVGVIAPTKSRCGINSSGNVLSLLLSGPCQVWGTGTISPANLTYTVVYAPNGTIAMSVARQNITGATYSLNSPAFVNPVSIVPQYQTITTQPIYVNLIPAANNAYTVGTASLYYNSGYFRNLFADNINGAITSITAKNINNILYCNEYAGADAGAKIAACFADLPASGGLADASGFQGAQAINQDVFSGVTKKVHLKVCGATFAVNARQNLPSYAVVEGCGRGTSTFQSASSFTNAFMFVMGDYSTLKSVSLVGRNVAAGSYNGIGATDATEFRITDVEVTGFDGDGIDTDLNATFGSIDHNYIHHNLNEGVYLPYTNAHIAVEWNYIYRNYFNGVDSNSVAPQIKNNWIYENGQAPMGTLSIPWPQDRDGILIYPINLGGAPNADLTNISDNFVFSNVNNGIGNYIGEPGTNNRWTRIQNNYAYLNGQSGVTTSGNGNGIVVTGTTSVGTLSGAMITNNMSNTNANHGLEITGTAATDTQLTGNELYSNIGSALVDNGTRTVKDGNKTQNTSAAVEFDSGIEVTNGATIDTATIMSDNKVQKCNAFSGANAGAKIVACIAALPSTGGTADARGLEGAQTLTNFWSGVTKPVTVLLGAGTYTTAVTLAFPNVQGLELKGLGVGVTNINYSGAATAISKADQTTNTSHLRLSDFTLTNTGTGTIGIDLTSFWLSTLEDTQVSGFTTGIYVSRGGNGTYWTRIQMNLVDGCVNGIVLSKAGTVGQTNQIWVKNNRIYNCTTVGIKGEDTEVYAAVVEGNDIETTTTIPRFIDWAANKSWLANNWFETSTGSDIAIYVTGSRNILQGNIYAGAFTPPPYVLVDTQNEVWEPSRFYTSTDLEVAGYIGAGFAATGLSTPLFPVDARGTGSGNIVAAFNPKADTNAVVALYGGNSATPREACWDFYQNTTRTWAICKDTSGALVIVNVIDGTTSQLQLNADGTSVISDTLTAGGKIRSNDKFNVSGTDGVSVTLSCPGGQAVKTLTTVGGIVTAATCGAP